MLLVVLLRILGSSIILKYPLFGAILAIILDYHDHRLLYFMQNGDWSNYQSLDKLLDLFYLSLEAYIVYHWKNRLARLYALVLFLYRLAGLIIFEITRVEAVLVIFPNVFEYFFLFYLVLSKFLKKELFTRPAILLTLVFILTFLKVPHEYLLHINTTQPWSKNKYVKELLNPDFIEEKTVETFNKITH
jgi:hypothetical protein